IKVNTLNRIAQRSTSVSREQSIAYAKQARILSDSLDYPRGVITADYLLSVVDGNHEKILYYSRLLLTILKSEGVAARDMVETYLDVGTAYLDVGKVDSGLINFEKGIELAKENGLIKFVGSGHIKMGATYYRQGNYEKAISSFYEALAIAEEHKDQALTVIVKRRLGDIYRKLGEHQKARESYFDGLKLIDEKQNAVLKAILYGSIASVYSLEGNYEASLVYHGKSLEVFERLGNKRNIAAALHNIGYLYKEQNQLDKALDYYLRSLKLIEEIQNKYGMGVSYEAIAGIYLLQNQPSQAITYLEKSLAIAQAIGDTAQLQSVYAALADAHQLNKDFEKALDFYKQAVVMKDSLEGKESRKQIADLESTYELNKKEQEIQLLNQDQQLKQQQRNILIVLLLLIFVIAGLVYSRQRLKMRKSQELLEKEREVDQLKTRFFTNISHEFRTPLTLIMGVNQQMQEQFTNPKIKDLLQLSSRNVKRLQQLINQLLDISKLESGKMALNLEELDVVEYIKILTGAMDSLAQQKGVSLHFESSIDRLPMRADRDKMEKMVTNLIANAIKFTEAGGQVCVLLSKSNGMFTIEVKDTGIGISPEHQQHIFNRFYQTDDSNTKNQEGTGIGLTLVKELVTLHQGDILLNSIVGEGSSFTLSIPLKPYELSHEPTSLANVAITEQELVLDAIIESGAVLDENHEGAKILIVEDNPDLHEFIKQYLVDYQVFSAFNGMEGLDKAIEVIPDLIISDVMMPEKDGYQLCAEIKKDMRTSHIPVILLTAKAGQESKYQGLETGADDYLIKPFDTKELSLKVRNIIESRKQMRLRFSESTQFKPAEIGHNSADQRFMEQVLAVLETHYKDEQFNVDQFAAEVGVSRSLLNSKLQALISQSTNKFIQSFRLQKAEELLKTTDLQVAEIAFQIGFNSSSYFVKCFRTKYGKTPKQFAESLIN
ncbi:MAG: tetratricopeptide repeat protein, partial [Flammeovirgaceae bacterium]